MNNNNFEYVNKFEFKNAKIIGKKKRGSGYVLTLYVKDRTKSIYPRIICRANIYDAKNLNTGDIVNGNGFIRAYKELLPDGTTQKHQYFVADKISLSKDLMTEIFGHKGNFFGESHFNIILSGKTIKVIDSGDFSYITIETDISVKGRKPSYITVTKPNNVTKPEKNDMIALALSLTTPVVKKKGQTKYLENLYVSDLVIV